MKKALVIVAMCLLPVTGAYAQTSGQAVMGFLLAQGSTYNGYTCPSSQTYPCFVQYGSSLPTGGGSSSAPSFTKPALFTIVPLDVSTVTTGGTAVTALTAGHKTAGGWLQNPASATQPLCINEIGTASGTSSSGNTTCVSPGTPYYLTPSSGTVSVVSSDSAHPFSGFGLN